MDTNCSLDGCYTWMLYVVFNISWQLCITNKELYGHLKVYDKVAARRLKLLGHWLWNPEVPASSLVLWELTHGRKSSMTEDPDTGLWRAESPLSCPMKVEGVSEWLGVVCYAIVCPSEDTCFHTISQNVLQLSIWNLIPIGFIGYLSI